MDCAEGGNIYKNETIIYQSKYPQEHYEEISLQKYGTKERWREILVEIEISNEPSFSVEKYQTSLAKQKARAERAKNKESIPIYQPNVPKCPTCQSTKIRKISSVRKVTGGVLFGIFSKTAFSQFECENCGYKW